LRRRSGSVGPAMRTAARTAARGPAAADVDRAPPPILDAVPPCWPRIAAAGGRRPLGHDDRDGHESAPPVGLRVASV
jgi:hypothetical protein